jgi:hypothetical protein
MATTTDNEDLLRKPDLDVLPSVDDLNNQFILGEMIENLGQLDPLHPNVEVGILIDWLKNVKNHEVDLESTMRKLLQAFARTNAYKEKFDPLDADIKAKITAFRKGAAAEEIVAKTGFKPTPSPSSQHRFKDLDYHQPDVAEPTLSAQPAKRSFWTKFQNAIGCFVEKLEEEERPAALELPDDLQARRKLFSKRWGGGDRVVYEDTERTKVMEVITNTLLDYKFIYHVRAREISSHRTGV